MTVDDFYDFIEIGATIIREQTEINGYAHTKVRRRALGKIQQLCFLWLLLLVLPCLHLLDKRLELDDQLVLDPLDDLHSEPTRPRSALQLIADDLRLLRRVDQQLKRVPTPGAAEQGCKAPDARHLLADILERRSPRETPPAARTSQASSADDDRGTAVLQRFPPRSWSCGCSPSSSAARSGAGGHQICPCSTRW